MRKMLFVALLLCSAVGAMAQVKFEDCSLKEALAKAKAENKLVMAIASTTWCGPCKAMAKDIYPLPEAGEYMNKNFVSKKYDLDIADPDNIKTTYPIMAYPTYLFLDGDGVEVARMTGGARDVAAFIERVSSTVAKENRWDARRERFKNDPSYAEEHIQYLAKLYLNKEAEEALGQLFANRTVAENYSPKSLEMYKSLVKSYDSPILKDMLTNKAEIMKVTGEKVYNDYLKELSTNIIFNGGRFNKADVIEKQLAFVKENPAVQSGMAMLVMENKDLFLSDGNAFIKTAINYAPKFTSEEKLMMMWYSTRACKDKTIVKEFGNALVKAETDRETVKKLKDSLSQIK